MIVALWNAGVESLDGMLGRDRTKRTASSTKSGRARRALLLCALLWCCLGSLIGPLSTTSLGAELLILESGEELVGRSVDLAGGYLEWELQDGKRLLIPLEWVARMDRLSDDPADDSVPDPVVAPLPGIPPAPEADVADDAVTAAPLEPEALPPEPAWTDSLPFYSTLHQGYLAVAGVPSMVGQTATTWTRRITFGGTFNDGNSKNEVLNTQLDFEHSPPGQLRQIEMTGQLGRNRGKRTSNRWNLNGNYDRPLSDDERWIVFITSKNEYDGLANLDYRGTLSAGAGIRFYNEAKKRLIVRMGPGYTMEIYNDPKDHRETMDFFSELEIRWPLRDRASLEHKVRVNPSVLDFEVVRAVSTSALLFDLDEKSRWKLRLGFNYTYNSEPAAGRLPSDYVSTVSLMYTRK